MKPFWRAPQSKNDGTQLEQYIQYVYQTLLNLNQPGTRVERRFDVRGLTATHNVDVYYEFTHLGIRHRVAFECKDWTSPVDIGEVRDFLGVLEDCRPMLGVMVAPQGFQEGAREYAEANGIRTVFGADVPHMADVAIQTIRHVFFPSEHARGEPFWTVMEVAGGSLTGAFRAAVSPKTGEPLVPLFFAKPHAEAWRRAHGDLEGTVIRGLDQTALSVQLLLAEKRDLHFIVFILPPSDPKSDWPGIRYSAADVRKTWLTHEPI